MPCEPVGVQQGGWEGSVEDSHQPQEKESSTSVLPVVLSWEGNWFPYSQSELCNTNHLSWVVRLLF